MENNARLLFRERPLNVLRIWYMIMTEFQTRGKERVGLCFLPFYRGKTVIYAPTKCVGVKLNELFHVCVWPPSRLQYRTLPAYQNAPCAPLPVNTPLNKTIT